AGHEFTATVATFSDANPNGTAAEFSAAIAWGDGTTSAGTVTANATGGFAVDGTHTYANVRPYELTVTITSLHGASASAISSPAAAEPPVTLTAVDVVAVQAQVFTGPVAVFTALDPTAVAEVFSVVLDWGDGTSPTLGSAAANAFGSFTAT